MTHATITLPFSPCDVADRLLAWYGEQGRDLPWRHCRDPYRVWLSEIMLQQTTVAAVVPYYQRFLTHFPTLTVLAAAPLDAVIAQWAGLGYYSRARNLHRAAQQLVADHAGRFPADLAALMTLPGVGRSTAGAILSIAFDTPAPILDGNVRRVLVRLFAWRDDPRGAAAEKQLWTWAEALTSAERPHDYAQAIMDLGATVCLPRRPLCGSCPLQELCLAHAEGSADHLPVRRAAPQVPTRRQVAIIVRGAAGVLVRQRPPSGLLGGLWEFPVADVPGDQAPEQSAASLLADLGLQGALGKAAEIRHAYSHFKLELTVFRVDVEAAGLVAENCSARWCPGQEMAGLPLHGAHRKAYDQVQNDN